MSESTRYQKALAFEFLLFTFVIIQIGSFSNVIKGGFYNDIARIADTKVSKLIGMDCRRWRHVVIVTAT